jgi:uncharacterized protein (DUF2062 family)
MRRWLKRVTPKRQLLENKWFLRPFARILTDPCCWSFNRHSVARAFSMGLFIAFMPPIPLLPVHFVLCTIFGVALRLNLPILFATVFVSNPFTWVPQVLASIWVGAKLLGLDLQPLIHVFKLKGFGSEMNALWGPLLLGAVTLGAISAAIGYATVQLMWRARVVYLMRRRRSQSRGKMRAFD